MLREQEKIFNLQLFFCPKFIGTAAQPSAPTSPMVTSIHANVSTAKVIDVSSMYSASPSTKHVSPPTTKSPITAGPPPTKKQKPKTPGGFGRRFDAASFIGGIILCGGVILLVYIGIKCFRSRPKYSKL